MPDDPRDDERVALRRLSVPARLPGGLTRRRFLQLLGGGAGAATAGMTLGNALGPLQAFAAPAIGPHDGVLVLVMLSGGNDGLNTLVPYATSRYYQLRPHIAIPQNQVLALDPSFGLHPSLPKLKARYSQGKVAVVRGVGYDPPDLSHFTSMGIWMNGWSGGAQSGGPTGWIGRYMDGLPNADTESLYGVVIGTSVPLHMVGATARASGLPTSLGDAFGLDRSSPDDARMFDAAAAFGAAPTQLGQWGDLVAHTERDTIDLGGRLAPAYAGTFPDSWLGRQLVLAARLVNANLGIRVISTETDGFDNHSGEPGDHAGLLTDLDDAIDAFFAALAPSFRSRVTLMTFSEFGRRPEDNDTDGTDHGTASCLFVVGDQVRGGMHGAPPSLTALDRDDNLVATTDFRSVYATVLDGWLGADSKEVLGYQFPSLPLFRTGPGGNAGAGGGTPTGLPHRVRRKRLTVAP